MRTAPHLPLPLHAVLGRMCIHVHVLVHRASPRPGHLGACMRSRLQVLCQFTLLNPVNPTWGAAWEWVLPPNASAKEYARWVQRCMHWPVLPLLKATR